VANLAKDGNFLWAMSKRLRFRRSSNNFGLGPLTYSFVEDQISERASTFYRQIFLTFS
jgi:hypothetical protein